MFFNNFFLINLKMLADVHAIGFHSHGKVTSTNQPPAVQTVGI